MVIFGVIAGAIVMSGWDFVSLVLLAQSLNASILFPLLLAITWHRTTAAGFSWGIILAVVIGMTVRHFYGELAGILTITSISAIVPLTLGLLSRKTFNFDEYSRQLQTSNDVESRVSHS